MKIKRLYNKLVSKLPPRQKHTPQGFPQKAPLDIYTVAFNNIKVIDYQIKLIRRFLPQNICHIICDNSSNPNCVGEIEALCKKQNICYISLPVFLNEDPSRNHGNALNWIFTHIIRERKNNFALLDHDVFPIRPVNITDLQSRPLCGVVLENTHGWFLWPGFSFYNYQYLSAQKVNFMPCKGLDTGGANYKSIYAKAAPEDICKIKTTIFNVYKKQEIPTRYPDYQKECIEFIGKDWIHTAAASQWIETGGKNDIVYAMLDNFLKD